EFRGRGKVAEVDRHVSSTDDDAFGNRFNNLAFFVLIKLGPAAVEVLGLGDDLIARQVLNFQEINLTLQLGDLVINLPEPRLHRLILLPETLPADLTGQI